MPQHLPAGRCVSHIVFFENKICQHWWGGTCSSILPGRASSITHWSSLVMNRDLISDKVFRLITKLPHAKYFQKKYRKVPVSKLEGVNLDMSIVATNCVGGEIYHILGRKFNTPFINDSMPRKSFVIMACRFKDYMRAPYRIEKAVKVNGINLFLEPEGLPVVRIRFPHDTNPDVVKNNWDRRVKRLNYDKLVFICDDRSLDDSDFALFDEVKAFKKIMLTSKEIGYPWAKVLPSYAGKPCVGDYNYKDYLRGIWKFEKEWDYWNFLL